MKYTEINQINPDVQAYIYQQCVDLERFQLPDSFLGVKLFAVEKDDKKGFKVVLIMSGGEAAIQSSAISKSIYGAIRKAKNKLLKKLVTIEDLVRGNLSDPTDNLYASTFNIH